MLRKALLSALVLVCLPFATGRAASLNEVVHAFGAVNGAWLDGPGAAFPADLEAGGTASASLSPHITAVASTMYGFSNSYVRWDGGFRVTATDAENPNFNVYLGIRYRGGSKADVRPNEWAPDAGFGWRPNPQKWPNIIVGADAGYGLESSRVLSYIALRYLIPLK